MLKRTLFIDADDTLWENNIFFEEVVNERFFAARSPVSLKAIYSPGLQSLAYDLQLRGQDRAA